ncbi:MAG: N-methyl-L-tryptophan oxidase [Planctomycetaceae bacterium]|nr:N-methyl-L-tryptophan oxidase [Planctomycetaceae bacterium]
MNHHFDVLVVGVGSMGSATCYQLARSGVRVLGLEQFNIPHARGSHHGGTRLIRQAYFEHPNYVELLKAVYPLWRELEAETNTELFHQVGALYLGSPDCELVAGSRHAATLHDIPFEWLSKSEVESRFPAFRCQDDWVGFYEPHAGYLNSEAAVAAMSQRALDAGAILLGQTKVVSWHVQGSQVTVRTEYETYTANRLVLCGGAWANRLLQGSGLSLKVTRQVVAWVWPQNPNVFQAGSLPGWAIDPQPAGQYQGIYYGFPLAKNPLGVKLGWHAPGLETDPDQIAPQVQANDLSWLPSFSERHMPALGSSLLGAATCFYTYSPDGHFIVDQHPQHDNVFFAAGFSGHGFKFAPIIGQALAELTINGSSQLPIDFLSLERFTHS